VALTITSENSELPPSFYMLLAIKVERQEAHDHAIKLFRRVYELDPKGVDAEMALYRMAQLCEKQYPEPTMALSVYGEMLRANPNGELSSYARDGLRRLNARNRTTVIPR
jgi:tetratricopeptide (TPR) repeat protein